MSLVPPLITLFFFLNFDFGFFSIFFLVSFLYFDFFFFFFFLFFIRVVDTEKFCEKKKFPWLNPFWTLKNFHPNFFFHFYTFWTPRIILVT